MRHRFLWRSFRGGRSPAAVTVSSSTSSPTCFPQTTGTLTSQHGHPAEGFSVLASVGGVYTRETFTHFWHRTATEVWFLNATVHPMKRYFYDRGARNDKWLTRRQNSRFFFNTKTLSMQWPAFIHSTFTVEFH